eukprot:TRINITY_DN14262_c0_g1_i1.p1 TRINITY_DN14262_c0_g1~~TRINITY_DN14262_c0_g1_i1.p1  ORF type:complete len:410 (-),score=117.54 TRINITY_DN14262_c0_g1_i1:86-1315(-)
MSSNHTDGLLSISLISGQDTSLEDLQQQNIEMQHRIKMMEEKEERSAKLIKSLEQANISLATQNQLTKTLQLNDQHTLHYDQNITLLETKLNEEIKKNQLLALEIQQLSQITTNLREDNGELNKLLQSSPQEILCISEQLKKHQEEQEEYKQNIRILTGVIKERERELNNAKKMLQLEELYDPSCDGEDSSRISGERNDMYTKKLESEVKLLRLQFSNANYKLKEMKVKKQEALTSLSRIRSDKENLLREIELIQSEARKLKDENRGLRLKIENHKEICPLLADNKNLQATKSPREPKPLQEIKSPLNSKKLKSMEEVATPTKRKSRQKSTSTPKKPSELTKPKTTLHILKNTTRHSDQENLLTSSATVVKIPTNHLDEPDPLEQYVNTIKTFSLDLPSPPMDDLNNLF